MRSMTGYGTAEGKVGKGRLFVEIKSVNHRFSEYNIKIPPRMGMLEAHIRQQLQPRFSRGKIDVFFKEKEPLFGGVSLAVDLPLARKYHQLVSKIRRELGLEGDEDFLEIVGLDRILHVEEREGSYERLWGGIARLMDGAIRHVVEMQLKEGAHLRADQERRLARLSGLVRKIHSQSARALGWHFERVRRKVAGGGDAAALDDQRVQQEVAFLGGRQDIAEELTRLESHLHQYAGLMRLREPMGRKLDFLLQEMNREANTIGAKAADARISQLVVDCKSELERLKEQVQNVE